MNEYKYGSYELRPYQTECYESVANHLRNLKRFSDIDKNKLIGAFFEASVGAGKTAIMGAILSRFVGIGWPALCLARDLKLVEQNADTFWDMKVENSIYSASYMKAMHYADKGVIVSNQATAYNAIVNGEWKDYVPRAVICDECHQVGTEDEESQYMQILIELNNRCIIKYGHRIVLLGGTGSPYRGVTSIIGDVWKECLYSIDTATLVSMGFLVPTIFGAEVGHDKSLDYDLSEFKTKSGNGTSDFSKSEMAAMENKMLSSTEKLQHICDEIVKLTKNRNAVMITCSGVKHCKEVQRLLPKDSAVIVHSGAGRKKKNDQAIAKIENREAKFLLQIGCLTTGFDCPIIDTSVILRRVGSLTLLVQLLGRGMRLLKDFHEKIGLIKEDHLVLDYAGTMDDMMELYSNPILEQCRTQTDKAEKRETQPCPICSTENSLTANQCIGIHKGKRCEFFFSFITCQDHIAPNGSIIKKGCGAKNSKKAKTCRNCGGWLNDPNENLNGQHYTENDLIPVIGFNFGLTKAKDRVLVTYKLANGKSARELFNVSSKEKWIRASWYKFLKSHCVSKIAIQKLRSCYSTEIAMQFAEDIKVPTHVTHRVNGKGYDLIARKVFKDD